MFYLKTVVFRAYIRNISRNYSKSLKVDPGVRKRTKILDNMEKDFDEDDLDELETDFMDVGTSYKEHQREQALKKERLKYLIVKQKYFKQKFPNFLTWHDKEQIKNLHRTDPEEWTIDKLSESFPALPIVIIKVINAKYEKTESRIVSHDKTVAMNWQLLKSGKMPDLPGDLVEHLNKFTDRSLNLKQSDFSQNKREVVNVFNNLIGKGEFSDIITSYQQLKKKDNGEDRKEVNINHKILHKVNDNSDTYVISTIKNKNMVTLSKLQENLEKTVTDGNEVSAADILLLKSTKKSSQDNNKVDLKHIDLTDLLQNKYQETNSVPAVKTKRDYSHLVYPEHILIPKNVRKRGCTYKLNDCYYDGDGEFLYRVPGMG